MSKDEKAGGEVVSKLMLDVRALTLLYDSDAELQPILEKAFTETQDEYAKRFARLLQTKQPSDHTGNLPIAIGEMVLAAFLTVIGIAAFVPVMAGLNTPQQWFTYVYDALSPSFVGGPLYSSAPLLDFIFSSLLLLGAFYSLRQAGRNLRRAGIVLEQRGS